MWDKLVRNPVQDGIVASLEPHLGANRCPARHWSPVEDRVSSSRDRMRIDVHFELNSALNRGLRRRH
jgi:hypothetical protein